MFLHTSFCLLYVLQLVVLSSLVPAYLSSFSNPRPPPPPPQMISSSSSSSLLLQLSPENDRLKSFHVKSAARMKPVSLTFLREHLLKVTSHNDLFRLLTSHDDEISHFSRWVSRTLQSISHTGSHGNHFSLDLHNVKSRSINLPDDESFDEFSDNPTEVDFESMHKSKARDTSVINEDFVEIADEGVADDYSSDQPQEERDEIDWEAFEAALHHIEERRTCSSFRCQQPSPFVLNVQDPHDGNRVFIPECVVLHRCMNYSGCCGDSNHECVPKSMSIVTKAFLVLDRLAGDEEHGLFDPKMATTLSFVNHTECECREKPKLPKCTKVCPKPFRLTQEGVHCVCDCYSLANVDNRACENIKEGLTPLLQERLMCIRRGNCYKPRCSVGDFDVNTGLCPLSDEYALPAFLFENSDDRRFYRDHLYSFDFSDLSGRVTAMSKGWAIVPTPSSFSAGVAENQQYTLESLTSRTVPIDFTPVRNSDQFEDSLQDDSLQDDSFQYDTMDSVQSTSNSQSIYEYASSESDSSMLISKEDHQVMPDSITPRNKSSHHLQSSHSTSFNRTTEDEKTDMYDNLYSFEDVSSSELGENESEAKASSQMKANDFDHFKDGSAIFANSSSTVVKLSVENAHDNETNDKNELSKSENNDDFSLNGLTDNYAERDNSPMDTDKYILTTSSSIDHAADRFAREAMPTDRLQRVFPASMNIHEHSLTEMTNQRINNEGRTTPFDSSRVQHLQTASSLSSATSSFTLPSSSSFQNPPSSTSTSSPSSLLFKSITSFPSTSLTHHSSSQDMTTSTESIPQNLLKPGTHLDNVLPDKSGEVSLRNPP